MWNWINCYLSGRHDYGMWCEPGAIFLRCLHCGRRSGGWALEPKHQTVATTPIPNLNRPPRAAEVLHFDHQTAAR
jgi:hypothetical protein